MSLAMTRCWAFWTRCISSSNRRVSFADLKVRFWRPGVSPRMSEAAHIRGERIGTSFLLNTTSFLGILVRSMWDSPRKYDFCSAHRVGFIPKTVKMRVRWCFPVQRHAFIESGRSERVWSLWHAGCRLIEKKHEFVDLRQSHELVT